MRFTSLTQRFSVWFMAVSLLPILVIGYSLLRVFKTEMETMVAQQVSAIADKKADQIDKDLLERVLDARALSKLKTTRQAMVEFAQVFAQSGMEAAAYHQLDVHYHDYFQRLIDEANYCDLFLVSPQGAVVYSQLHKSDFASNLFTGPYSHSGLAQVSRQVLSTLESSISDFDYYPLSGDAIVAFIAAPVMQQNKLLGILALQINNVRLWQVLTDNVGLGASGETVVARSENAHTALVMAPLTHQSDAALKRKIPLHNPQLATAIGNAILGRRGSGIITDYRGVKVVAAWRYLPRMGWGMAVKTDVEEALAPVYRVRTFSLIILGLALFAALVGAVLLGRRIVMPLQNLSHSAQEIAAGNLQQRVPPAGQDELGQLAVSFNTMAAELSDRISQQKQAQRQLEAANKELESFSYSVSHDLRAPLRHIQGYAEMLTRASSGQLSAKAQQYLETITDASMEMGQLIDDLLTFSRISRIELYENRVILDELVQDAIRGLEIAMQGRNILWKIAPLPPALGDPSLLKQVFTNLLDNALKYSRQRDLAEIEIGCAGEENGQSILFVRDNGAGFDMQYAHKLFGVFQRLHRADEFEGTGIGLATVRRIIARHGGRIWAEGAVNHGATFYFTLRLPLGG
ncbi:ATP-binding protein [Nitrosococcus wardiae]|uniref:sensor histidine kinase n=1 Tax=Nitrosococcus wardiae TaxID=1814290 RepID=UPI00141BBE50|nr:ATP-binding protein [Nitrosococcus wardiae]